VQEAKSVAPPPSKPEARAKKPGKLAKPDAEEAKPKAKAKAKAKLKGGGRGREGRSAALREPAPRMVALPLPLLPPVRRATIEERAAQIDARLNAQSEEFRRRYIDSFDMSWIYHDSALEGVVYTFDELRAALNPQPQAVADSSLQPTFDDIRRHKEAIEYVRDFAIKKRLPVTLDVIKKIYLILHPEEGDIKTVKYRKDIPQHRLYFHEYAPPDKIAYKVRQIVDWLNDPETRKTRNGIRIAARAHYDLLRVYPFATDSGKVSRLFMNLLLMRTGLPPSILHSTERQRYYEALKGSATTVLQMVQEAVENALSSVEKLLNEAESRKRAFIS
jgi:Fic family protein